MVKELFPEHKLKKISLLRFTLPSKVLVMIHRHVNGVDAFVVDVKAGVQREKNSCKQQMLMNIDLLWQTLKKLLET